MARPALAVFIAGFILFVPFCAAENEFAASELPDRTEFFNHIVTKYKIAPDSKRYVKLKSQIAAAPAEEEVTEETEEAKGTLQHFRGNEGIRFAEKKQGEEKLPSISDQDLKTLAKKAVEISDQWASSSLQTRPLPPCAEGGSERVNLEIDQKEYKKLTYVDTLFIDADDLPADPKAAFGEKTTLQTYRNDPKNRANYAAKGYHVTCLPTRIIITGKQSIRLWGEQALRNYDNNPNGKGKAIWKGKEN